MNVIEKRLVRMTLAAFMSCLMYGCAQRTVIMTMQPEDASLGELAWLAGSWASQDATQPNAMISEEHWTQPRAGTMLGMNRTTAEGKTVFFEYLRIESRSDGIYYLASPKGRQPATPFKLTRSEPGLAVFENPQHDFPQRIIYELEGEMLRGRIEGMQNGQAASEDWVWRAVHIR